ncbi:hypothetical protein GCM10010211_78060 [Streptomyces albospinus]|uniref:Transposase n=1 Tax=Streptomyces albospinus TaxID=285515 RepID=A0ABQ2VQZ4_9ACTN|nr:hypothetical protein GCM10010211_78060 [Streptomyces albospinus]
MRAPTNVGRGHGAPFPALPARAGQGLARFLASSRARGGHFGEHCSEAPMSSTTTVNETSRRLSVPLQGTVRCVQARARLVRALYERLDRLDKVRPVRAL